MRCHVTLCNMSSYQNLFTFVRLHSNSHGCKMILMCFSPTYPQVFSFNCSKLDMKNGGENEREETGLHQVDELIAKGGKRSTLWGEKVRVYYLFYITFVQNDSVQVQIQPIR